MQDSMENSEPEVSEMRDSSHGNLLEVLNELHGKICFVKEMTATNVRPLDRDGRFISQKSQSILTLPKSFVDAHKTKVIPTYVVFYTGVSNKSWSLRLSYCNRARGQPDLTFTSGWRQFVTDNGVVKGDILVFSLTAMSEFQVYMFDSRGLPKTPRTLLAASTSSEIKVSLRILKVLESLGNKREDWTTSQGIENLELSKSCVNCSKRKAISDDEIIDLASNASCQKTCHDSDCTDQEELAREDSPLSDQDERNLKSFTRNSNLASDRNLNRSQKSTIHAPLKTENLLQAARFHKQLGKRNLVLMEIPASFMRKYGCRLQTRVQLQGVLQNSPVRDVRRVFYMSAGQYRCFLRDGWHDFVKDNMLREGQYFLFTLTADSFFEVREAVTP